MDTPGLDHWADITVVAIYFVLVLAVGLWSLCRPNRGSVKSYFLAGRDMKWFPVGASLFSSNIGSEHFVGLAGTGAASGIAMVMYEWISMPLVICLGWIFLPVYISAGVYTMPEYMEKRFGGKRIRVYLSCLSLVLYIVTKLAVSIYAGGLFIKLALAWNMYISVTGLLLITGLYTVLGGLAAVIYTDTFQTVVMTIGALILCAISFDKIGGYEALQYKYMEAIPSVRANNTTCGEPRADAFHIFRDPINSDNPWPGLLIQTSLGCLWYWCCDQVIVQRTLAAKNLTHAKAGSILAGYLKLLPLFLMIFPGMISRALYPDSIGCVDPAECEKYCENAVGCSNIAYPKLVLELLPVGLRGLLMAVMLSAIMSSLTSIFNSASTLFTMDLWRRMRPVAQERELLIVGRLFVLFLCGVSILWIPLVKSSQGGQLFNYIQAVQGYLGTPITSLFVMAVFWKRMNENGAFWGIAVGHVCGVIRMAVDFSYPAPECGEEESRPSVLLYVHYTYFGSMILIITCISIVIFSLISKAPTEEQLRGVTYWTRIDKLSEETRKFEEENLNSFNGHSDMKLESSEEVVIEETETKGCNYWARFICGLPENKPDRGTPGISQKQIRQFLYENPKWQTFMNINAALGCVVMAFLTGFFH
ncbi:sodium/mannose cotransporter SLC5A10 [Patella vulgata]|uniref:sodium/mannose cotransporter SLC5A10 n=1 Tax=Patella vulgata TaxID=6465 RepID=UPI00217F9287|nr:sodium/mannose cotransporter SLC5A10 [Patella vulgata]